MCGIFALLETQIGKVDTDTLKRMSQSIAHRGPDDYGYAFIELMGTQRLVASRDIPEGNDLEEVEGLLVFGHRRLSIIDLTEAGHQPMCNENGHIWVTYNGEIYNYRELAEELIQKGHIFKSRTDTEVILHAYEEWGIECLQRFNGMWAFALWDGDRRRLFCARDRFGIKPFYYYLEGRKFILASEIKALLQDRSIPKSPNHKRIYDYLSYGYRDHTEETFFQGIYQLPGAHYLTLDISGSRTLKLEISRYWNLRTKEFGHGSNLKETFYELLQDSIRMHMRSDVAVGTCLSGGLDSSSIVCIAKQFLNSNVHKTFSACFDETKYDERHFISDALKISGSDPYYVFPKAEELLKELKKLIWHQEEPFGSTSVYAQWSVFKLAKQHDVKVILDGQGADELLAGYHPYFGSYLSELLRTHQVREFLNEYRSIQSIHRYSHYWIIAHLMMFVIPQTWVTFLKKRVLHKRDKWLRVGDHGLEKELPLGEMRNVFFNDLYLSLMYFTLPRLLHYEDRNSMAHSIEARVPFLDYRLAEFIFSLPMNYIVGKGLTKVILRETMKGILPESVRNRRDKIGFATPEEIWFRGPLRDRILEILDSKSFAQRGFFVVKEVKRTFERFCRGEADLSPMIWRWVNLELWFRIFIEGIGGSLG